MQTQHCRVNGISAIEAETSEAPSTLGTLSQTGIAYATAYCMCDS
jgi:hypothetical protein